MKSKLFFLKEMNIKNGVKWNNIYILSKRVHLR